MVSLPPARAIVKRSRPWNAVWLIPLVTLLLAGWLVWQHYRSQGVLAHIRFETAANIESGSTEVRCRSVRIGVVQSVQLSADLLSVVVDIRIDPDAGALLRKGTRLWVVRPQFSAASVSGLGTLIKGSYIELDPGEGPETVTHFDGLEAAPVTKSSVPGLRLTLTADRAESLNAGSPIYYNGFEVGKVELRTFDVATRRTRLSIFISEAYAPLVNESTCFWNTGGIDVSAGAEGFRLRTPSVQAMLAGGISFGIPPGTAPGAPAQDGAEFSLFANEAATRELIFRGSRLCLLMFDRSVRGLQKGAPVEFRGIPMGRVTDISLKYAPPGDKRVPVLIEMDPGLLRTTTEGGKDDTAVLSNAVKSGLRARLSTGSLLTGALFIDLDYVPEAPPAELGHNGEYDLLPTHSSGLVQLEAKVNDLLTKLTALPLEDMMNQFGRTAEGITRTAQEAETTLAEARKLLANQKTQGLTAQIDTTLGEIRASVTSLGPAGSVQGDLRRTLDELRAALRAFKTLSTSVAEKPNSLIFGRDSTGDPVPKARKK
ncbi:MAG: MCE family protein [Verrucomicrobiaceae bacterium]|nr:MAG: MCE family protein [Verrucomicrobiaceae bacterium]